MSEQDHDLLIRVHENIQNLTNIVTSKFADHEARLRGVEKDTNFAKGALKITYLILTLLTAAIAAVWYIKH